MILSDLCNVINKISFHRHKHILLCSYNLFSLSIHETMKYATFRYDSVDVKNRLYSL